MTRERPNFRTMMAHRRRGHTDLKTRYIAERDAIRGALSRRASAIREGLREMEGVTCNEVEGALYAFPSITLPSKFVEEAMKRGVAPDALWVAETDLLVRVSLTRFIGRYAEKMLLAAGVCIVPGSGFGQVEGTYHFRTTILPAEDQMPQVLKAMQVGIDAIFLITLWQTLMVTLFRSFTQSSGLNIPIDTSPEKITRYATSCYSDVFIESSAEDLEAMVLACRTRRYSCATHDK